MGVPGSASRARTSAAAMSRLASPEPPRTCRPTYTSPSVRTSAGQASGRTVASVTVAAGRAPRAGVSGAVAAGTISRSATQSASPVQPGERSVDQVRARRATRPVPWQAL